MSTKQLDIRVGDLDCDHDAVAIKRSLSNFPGLNQLKGYPKAAKVSLLFDPEATTPETLKEKLDDLGFPPQAGLSMPEHNPKVLTASASGMLLLVGWLLSLASLPETISLMIYIVATITSVYYFGRETLEELIHEREIAIELLVAIAAIVATAMGRAAEGYTEDKTCSAVKALMDLAPKFVLVQCNG